MRERRKQRMPTKITKRSFTDPINSELSDRDRAILFYSELSNSISFNVLQNRMRNRDLGRALIDYCMERIDELSPDLKQRIKDREAELRQAANEGASPS